MVNLTKLSEEVSSVLLKVEVHPFHGDLLENGLTHIQFTLFILFQGSMGYGVITKISQLFSYPPTMAIGQF